MKILYIDCFAGISGDMFLGALLDLGLDVEYLKRELKKISLSGYSISVRKEQRKGITGTRFIVDVTEVQKERHLKDILGLINKSGLSASVKKRSIELFTLLGKAEAKVHGASLETVHFHEVGAVDSIIDTIGAVIGIEKMGFKKIFASRVRLGGGMLGAMPLPAPAAAEVLKGVPIEGVDRQVEMVTPTGAVLLKGLVDKFCGLPLMSLEKSGYGIGGRDDKDIPNVLRVIAGEAETADDSPVYVIETNIDDMNPQRYGVLMEGLFSQGALDVFWTAVQMKKNRPGVLVTVLAEKANLENILGVLFQKTTTFGVRYHEVKRRILDRETKKVKGKRIKIGKYNGKIITIKPEYEDWKDAL